MTAFDPQKAADSLYTTIVPEIGLCPQASSGKGSTNGIGWVYISTGGALQNTILLTHTFEPNENMKNAYVWAEHPPTANASAGATVMAAIKGLPTASFMPHGYHLPWNDEAMLGIPIPYSKSGNKNVDFCGPPDPKLKDGSFFGVFQATAVASFGTAPKYNAPNMNVKSANYKAGGFISEGCYQVMNLFIRGMVSQAQANIELIAGQATKNSDGSVLFGSAPARGIYLGGFLHVCKAMKYEPKTLTAKNITLDDIDATLGGLQAKSGGGIPRQYSNFSSMLRPDPETSNAAALAGCTKLQAALNALSTSGKYNATTIPPATLA
jgi:hypothetical protein